MPLLLLLGKGFLSWRNFSGSKCRLRLDRLVSPCNKPEDEEEHRSNGEASKNYESDSDWI